MADEEVMEVDESFEVVALRHLHAISPEYAARYQERIEVEQRHRIFMEQSDQRLAWAGLASGLTVTMSFLVATVHLVTSGHEIPGTILGTVDLIALTALFITRSRAGE